MTRKERDLLVYETERNRYVNAIKETPFFKRSFDDHVELFSERVEKTIDYISKGVEIIGIQMEKTLPVLEAIEYAAEEVNELFGAN